MSCYHICTCPTSLISMTAIFCKPSLTLLYGVFDPHAGWPSGKVKPTLVTLNVGHILSGDQNHSCMQYHELHIEGQVMGEAQRGPAFALVCIGAQEMGFEMGLCPEMRNTHFRDEQTHACTRKT